MNIIQQLLSAVAPLPDGDLTDRLNYCYTSTLLIVCSAFISGWSFFGSAISCWFPAYYRGWWMEYALDYCYIQNTYFLGFTEVKPDNYFDIAKHIIPIPKNHTEREEKQIGYYQWVPFVLALQAVLFYLPVVLWRSVYNSTGFKVQTICETCNIKSNMEQEERSKNMEIVARFLIYDHDVTKNFSSKFKSALEGRIVSYTYLLVKLIYSMNALFQFLLVKWLLGTNTLLWGWEVAQDLIVGREWPETGNFPRITMCDFSIRVLGNLHRHSIQCVLMINMFNEKIFVFLWFWFCIVAIWSFISFCQWLLNTFNHGANHELIASYLVKIDSQSFRGISRKHHIKAFIQKTLRPDGLFLIRLVSINSGDLVTCQLLTTLWRDYLAAQVNPTGLEERHPPPYDEPIPLLLEKKPLD